MMKTNFFLVLFILAVSVLFSSCTKEAERDFIRVITHEATNISNDGVNLNAQISNIQGNDNLEYGFLIYRAEPTSWSYIGRVEGTLKQKNGVLSAKPVIGMKAGDRFFYRGYILSGGMLSVGNVCSFQSKGSRPASIETIHPLNGTIGDTVYLQLSGIIGGLSGLTINFNSHVATKIDFVNNILRVRVPAGLADFESTVSITTENSTMISDQVFQLLIPEITDFNPKEVYPGDIVTITGINFSLVPANNDVRFNNHRVTVLSSSSTEIKVLTPYLEGAECEITLSIGHLTAVAEGKVKIIVQPVLWLQKSHHPAGKIHKMGAFVIGDYGYTGVGAWTGHQYNDKFWRYDPGDDSWTQIAKFPGILRVTPHSFSVGNKGYISGGSTLDSPSGVSLRDVYEYDPEINSWTRLNDYPGIVTNNFFGISEVVNNVAYMAFSPGSFYSYNPATSIWTKLSDPVTSHNSRAGSFVIGNTIYVVGGIAGTGSYKKDVWAYNTITDTWTRKSDFPGSARMRGVGFTVNDEGFFGFGYDGSKSLKDLWRYNTEHDVWIRTQDFTGGPRSEPFAMAIGNMVFIGTGWLSQNSLASDVFRFNPTLIK